MVQVDEKGRKYGIELLDECQHCSYCPIECWKYDDSLKAQVLHVRDVTEEEARQYISDFLEERKEKETCYSDVMDKLGLDMGLVIKLCKEMEKEGLISMGE